MPFTSRALSHASATCSLSGDTSVNTWLAQGPAFTAVPPRRSRAHRVSRRGLHVCASLKDVAGVLVFSALPFASVQALADSKLGKELRERVDRNKPRLEAEKQDKERLRAQARAESMWYGPERPKWLGPLAYSYPEHLRGEAPGDYGYDVANLGADAADFERHYELEVLHGRWAMLGALGALLPEVLQYGGVADFLEPRWWNVGYAKLQGEDLNYLGVSGLRIAGGQGILIIAICQVLLMFGPEYARACGIAALEPLGIYLPGDKQYPGGVFDPLGLADDPAAFEELKVKEQKHSRLAMIAWLGFFAQAYVTKKGPVENLLDFFADPVHENVAKYL